MNGLQLLVVGLALSACGAEPKQQPARSPTTDYPPPPPRDAQGQVIGADGVRPEDRLSTSPRVGSEGAVPAQQPGDRREGPIQTPVDPCRQIGLTDPEGRSECERRNQAR